MTRMTATIDQGVKLEPDPLWDVQVGEQIDRLDRTYWNVDDGIACTARRSRDDEQENHWDEGWGMCSRQAHPEHWKHIAVGGSEVVGSWGGIEISAVEPGDADEADAPPAVEMGQIRKLRQRRDILLVLGPPNNKGKVPVLDLTHERYRELRPEQVVERKPNADPPTPEQLAYAARWMSQKREQERKIALRELGTGRFDVPTLTRVLADLDLAPYYPRYSATGRFGFEIKYEGRARPRTQDVQARMFRAFEEWLKTNPVEGLEITTSEYNMRVNHFSPIY